MVSSFKVGKMSERPFRAKYLKLILSLIVVTF